MTTKTLGHVAVAVLLLAWGTELSAQEPPDSIQEIRLVDGSTLFGRVVERGDTLGVRLVSGDLLRVASERVRDVRAASGAVRDGEFWRQDPNLTRLFFSPTARTLRRGEGYLAAYELALPFVAVGLTDRLLIAGGTPLFGGLEERPVYLAPKLRVFSGDRTDVAVGALVLEVLGGYSRDPSLGVVYGVLTQGTPDQAITLGVGWGFEDRELMDEPVVMFGGEFRVSRTLKIVTETYLLPDAQLFAVGPRFFGERLSADLGIGFVHVDGDFVTLPLVNFVYGW